MSQPFAVACRDPQELASRVTVAPLRLITESSELARGHYQAEGVITADMQQRRELSAKELGKLAVPLDTPGALRLVRVPKDMGALMQALRHNGPQHTSAAGTVIIDTRISVGVAPPYSPNTTINPNLSALVGNHIDAMQSGESRSDRLMGIAAGLGGRSITVAPSINMSGIPEDLHWASDPEARFRRRALIRENVQALLRAGETVPCYIFRLDPSPDGATYEAYVNMQAQEYLHDGATPDGGGESMGILMKTSGVIHPSTFPSIV